MSQGAQLSRWSERDERFCLFNFSTVKALTGKCYITSHFTYAVVYIPNISIFDFILIHPAQ